MVVLTRALERRRPAACGPRLRRAALFIVAVGLLSLAWRVAQPWVTYLVGVASVGAPRHPALLHAALRVRHPDFPSEEQFSWAKSGLERLSARMIASDLDPCPGWVRVCDWARCEYYDRWLNWTGRHSTRLQPVSAPVDADGDGQPEVIDSFEVPDTDKGRDASGWMVVRLGGATTNQFVCAAAVDWRAFKRSHPSTVGRVSLRPIWRDEDGDGCAELVFVAMVSYNDPRWGFCFRLGETVAVLEWTHPGGMLVPRSLPPDCGIEVWIDRAPVDCDPNESLQALGPILLPLPATFGR